MQPAYAAQSVPYQEAPAPASSPAPAPASNLDLPPDEPLPPRAEPQVPLRWPYFDLEYGGLQLDNRYQSIGVVWIHVGAYAWERLHLTARFGVPQADMHENTEQSPPVGFTRGTNEEDFPGLFGNLGVGYVFSSSGAFVFAPSITFHLSDKSDFGYGAGVMVPFVWVTRRGFRIGFEASVMRVFGGSVRYTCTTSQLDGPCDTGEVREFNRAAGSGFSAGFVVGYGTN